MWDIVKLIGSGAEHKGIHARINHYTIIAPLVSPQFAGSQSVMVMLRAPFSSVPTLARTEV